MTLDNSCCYSGFPYTPASFRRYRHYLFLRTSDLSAISMSPGVASNMTIQGDVCCVNQTSSDFAAGDFGLYFTSIYLNRSFQITRVSASVSAVTASEAVGASIRTGQYASRV